MRSSKGHFGGSVWLLKRTQLFIRKRNISLYNKKWLLTNFDLNKCRSTSVAGRQCSSQTKYILHCTGQDTHSIELYRRFVICNDLQYESFKTPQQQSLEIWLLSEKWIKANESLSRCLSRREKSSSQLALIRYWPNLGLGQVEICTLEIIDLTF